MYNWLYRYLHIFGESQQVVVGDGGLSCTSGSNKQHGLFMCYISLQEEDLTSCLRGLDNQVTDLDTCNENKINSSFIKSKIIFHKHILQSLKTCFSKTINYCFQIVQFEFFPVLMFTDLGWSWNSQRGLVNGVHPVAPATTSLFLKAEVKDGGSLRNHVALQITSKRIQYVNIWVIAYKRCRIHFVIQTKSFLMHK